MKLALIALFFLLAVAVHAEEKTEEKPASKSADELVAAALEAALAKLSPEHRKIVKDTLRSAEKVEEAKVEDKKDERRVRRQAW